MPGPLATMFAGLNKQNDDDYRQRGHGLDREVFQTRLSNLNGAFPPNTRDASGEPPIVLGEDPQAQLIPSDFPSLGYNDQRPGQGPMPFRDPGQAGPQPPIDPRILAQMFGGK